jgi:hypothetical protein
MTKGKKDKSSETGQESITSSVKTLSTSTQLHTSLNAGLIWAYPENTNVTFQNHDQVVEQMPGFHES